MSETVQENELPFVHLRDITIADGDLLAELLRLA